MGPGRSTGHQRVWEGPTGPDLADLLHLAIHAAICHPPCHHSRQPRLHLFLSSCTGTALHHTCARVPRQSIGLKSNARPRPGAMIGWAPARDQILWAANLPPNLGTYTVVSR